MTKELVMLTFNDGPEIKWGVRVASLPSDSTCTIDRNWKGGSFFHLSTIE
jgi:hypothetical protein